MKFRIRTPTPRPWGQDAESQPDRRRRHAPKALTALGILLAVSVSQQARADVEIVEALALFARGASTGLKGGAALPRTLLGQGPSVPLIVERDALDRTLLPGAIPIGGGFMVLDVASRQAEQVALAYPSLRFSATPPRRLLLDRAAGWVRVSEFKALGGGTGQGVVIGIVDSGVDVTHADLRRSDGSTRVKWLIDFTRGPAGYEPEIEAELGCGGAESCAVYSARDIDSLIANGVVGDEPRDNIGHGTHIASLAAGNGLSSSPARFVGLAPEADLVIARVTGGDSGISDSTILRSVRFVFDRADELGEPAVVNLSLGSDFGAHDGSSVLERALSSFVGADRPGRAIVVAAGNSGGLFAGPSRGFPGPFGIHTDVHVPRESSARIPILTPPVGTPTTRARVSAWLGFRPGDALSVSFDRDGRTIGSGVPPGSAAQFVDGALEVVILNGVGTTSDDPLAHNAAVIFEGEWPSEESFGIQLEGSGTASVWVEGTGALDPGLSVGPLLPFATKEGTISVPASASDLIAVGATLNRTDWLDFEGADVFLPRNGALAESRPDGTAFFSSAGPNALGALKPEIVAPGMHIAGALSALADPRTVGNESMFSGSDLCPSRSECLVVDDFHAISSGTSMAAPLVAGAVALLFERDSGLVQHQIRALLQAGARRLEGQVFSEQQAGVGGLDLEGSLTAQIAEDSPLARVPGSQSSLSLAASYARPDPTWSLTGYVELRDDRGKIVDGFEPRRLSLSAQNALLLEPLLRIAAGFYRFAVAAPLYSGGTSLKLSVSFDGTPLIEREVPIAVDRGALEGPLGVRGGSGCGVTQRTRQAPLLWSFLAAWWGLWLTRAQTKAAHGGSRGHAASRKRR